MDETATYRPRGRKEGRPGRDHRRQAGYDGTVIIYYQSEKDVLDYDDHELWVDTGDGRPADHFGHILKTNEIRRFPI